MVRTLRLFDTGGWVLPWRVADAEGYFADEGFAVEFVRGEGREAQKLLAGTADLAASDKEAAFVGGQIDIYSACEWGVIKRVVDLGAGKIIANRRTVGMTHGIYVLPNRGLTSPADLRGVPVAVNLNSGSHFAVVEGLEEVLRPEDVKIVHFGHPYTRAEALFTGKVEAAALMEPYSTLAEVRGAVKIADYPGRGGWIGGDQLTQDELDGFYRAVRRAVATLNAEPEKYRARALQPPDSRARALDPAGGDHTEHRPLPAGSRRQRLHTDAGRVPRHAAEAVGHPRRSHRRRDRDFPVAVCPAS
jgi:NitT/TauT family transport system substrate-binding protein